MKSFPVKIHANNKTGQIFELRKSTSEDGVETTRAHMMVQQQVLTSFGNTIATRTRTAWTSFTMEAFEVFKDILKDKEEFPVDGKIIIQETFTPYKKKNGDLQECKQYPSGHPKAGHPVLSSGKKVYRNLVFSALINGVYQQGSGDILLPTDKPNSVPNVSPEDAFDAPE